MRRLIRTIHLVLGLVSGIFIVVLGTTGSILAFEPEIDNLFHRDLSHVTPAGRVLSLVEIGDAVSRKYDGENIVAFLPSTSPHVPAEVILSRGVVSVNQYTGQVLGLRTRGQSFLGLVRALHVRLASGELGKSVLRWSAIGMVFSLLSGLYLWWPRKHLRIHGAWGSTKFWYDMHQAIGIFSLLPLFVLAATGAVIGFEDQWALLLDKVSPPPTIYARQIETSLQPEAGAVQITPDRAVEIACSRLRGAIAYRVQMPRYGGRYQVNLLNLDDRIASGRNSISIDPWTGTVLSVALGTDLSFRERVAAWNEAMHTGDVFGITSRIVVAAASILVPIQVVSGCIIWLRRSRLLSSFKAKRALS